MNCYREAIKYLEEPTLKMKCAKRRDVVADYVKSVEREKLKNPAQRDSKS